MRHRGRTSKLRIASVCFSLALFFPSILQAQVSGDLNSLPEARSEFGQTLRFETMTVGKGISQGTIFDLFQDRKGYIWIATQGGLNRFDGYVTKVYTPQPFDSTSLSDGWVWSINESRDGSIWVGTASGRLDRLDVNTGRFEHFRNDPEDSTSIPRGFIFATAEDASGSIWVAASGGLAKLDPKTGTAIRFANDPNNPDSVPDGEVFAVTVGDADLLWAGTEDGLSRINTETGEVRNFLVDLNPTGTLERARDARPGEIYRIYHYETDPEILWLATGQGFIRFDTRTEEWKRYLVDDTNLKDPNAVYDLAQDPNEEDILWVTTQGKGLARFNKQDERIRYFQRDRLQQNSLTSNAVTSLATDRSGMMWVGTQSGLNRFNPASVDFLDIETIPYGFGSTIAAMPWSLMVQRTGAVWIGIDDAESVGYLMRIDPVAGDTTVWKASDNDVRGPGRARFRGLYEDDNGDVWIGSGAVVSKYDHLTGRFRQWRHDPADSTSLRFTVINHIVADNDASGELWLGTSRGLDRFDPKTDKTESFRLNPDPNAGPGYVVFVQYDRKGMLWVTTADQGLFRMNADRSFTNFRHYGRDSTTLSGDFVNGFAERESEPGILWVATNLGIDRLDTESGRVTKHLSTKDGLPDNVQYALIFDDAGDLWYSTNNGIGRYDPDSGEIRNYGLDSGLLQLEYMQDVVGKGSDGTLYFGHVEGVTVFNPSRLRHNPLPPAVVLSDFKIHNRSVSIGPDSPLEQPLDEAKIIKLAANQNVFSFDFLALHYGSPEKNEYAYKLDGWDDEWNNVGHLRTASYTNLPAGKYTFRVKAANADGVWNNEGKSVDIIVRPPWWKTWWAYVTYVLLAALGVFGVDRIQRRRLALKERERSHILEAQLKADAQEKRREDAERMSEIGRAITSTLSVHGIIDTVYENVNALMDASVFGVGVYNEAANRIDFPASKEQGKTLPAFSHDSMDMNRLSSYCLARREDIIIGDYPNEYSKYVTLKLPPVQGEAPDSVVYLPLIHQGKAVGVLTAQSFAKNAYSDYHISVLRGLASYSAIALDNANAYRQLGTTVENLKSAQASLVQSEKMASLGEMTAGIAHEIKNPLNFVNNFAELNAELADELVEELRDRIDLKPLLDDMKSNALQIAEHGKRADSIVRAMMQHASGGSSHHEQVDVNELVEEYIGLAFHGMRASEQSFNVTIQREFGESAGSISAIPQEIGRVLLNLLGNAFYVVREKSLSSNGEYKPTVTVRTGRVDDRVEICVRDNGNGIPENVKTKIFEPFFTTKPTGSGTGLGLSLSYDIVTKGHGGEMTVESEPGKGASFLVSIPIA